MVGFPEIFSGNLLLVPLGRLNSTFKVLFPGEKGYFFKQASPGADIFGASFDRETSFLEAAAENRVLCGIVPRLICCDTDRRVAVLELYENDDSKKFPSNKSMASLGRVLADFHTAAGFIKGRLRGQIPHYSHWTLSISQKPTMHLQNAGQKSLFGMILRYPQLGQALADYNELWQCEGLIHGDMKWDNCICSPNTDGSGIEVRIADWETVRMGDFDWDCASVVQDIWARWIASMPLDRTTPPEAESGAVKPDDMRQAVRAFWQSYKSTRAYTPAEAERRLEKIVRFAAARLLQTASEQSGNDGDVGYSAVSLVQLSLNITKDPASARKHLVGL